MEEGHPGRHCDYRRERPLPETLRPCREVAGKNYSGFSRLLPSGLLLGFPLAETREQGNSERQCPGVHFLERRAESD